MAMQAIGAALSALILMSTSSPGQAAGSSVENAERYATCGGFLEGAAFDRHGILWVVDLASGDVLSIGADRKCVRRISTHGKPNGARFHRDGRLFIADNDRGIIALDTKTMAISLVVDDYKGEKIAPNDLTFDEEGGLYFTVPGKSDALSLTGRVFYLAPKKDAELQMVAAGMSYPNGLVVSLDAKHLIVGQATDKSIVLLPLERKKPKINLRSIFVRTEGGLGPDGMTLDEAGNLYWAEFGDGTVQVANARGHMLARIPLGTAAGSYTTNLAFNGGWLYVTEAEKGEIWRVPVDRLPRN